MSFNKFLAILCLSMFSAAASAVTLQFASTPTEAGGPFLHNVFHEASSNGGQSGNILAWFDLGSGGGSWDTGTGAFNINVDVFADAALTMSVGTATGIGSLDSMSFNGDDGGLIGSIDWVFNTTVSGLVDTTTSFVDKNYATSSAGFVANSTDATSMTLWGANGTADNSTGNFTGSTMGVDLVVTFVPVPAAIWLFGSGLLGLVAVSRRKS